MELRRPYGIRESRGPDGTVFDLPAVRGTLPAEGSRLLVCPGSAGPETLDGEPIAVQEGADLHGWGRHCNGPSYTVVGPDGPSLSVTRRAWDWLTAHLRGD